jgi:hypothetical protein
MPIGPVEGYPVGNARGFVGEYVQSGTYTGYFSGQQASLTAGTASGAYVIKNIKGSPFGVIPPTNVQIQGGDKIVQTVSFIGGKLAAFDVPISSIDSVLADLVGGGTTNNTNTYEAVVGYNTGRTSPKSMFYAAQQMFKTTSGLSYFLTRVVPRASLSYRPGGMVFRGESDAILTVDSIPSQLFYNGLSYGTGGLNLGMENDTVDFADIITENPIHFMAYKSDNSTLTFNTVYKPLSTVITNNATPNRFVIAGTPTALSSITLAGLATLSAAGASGVMNVLTHQTNFVPI